jgi:RimJ/RimL family protein N-acetyltransferase
MINAEYSNFKIRPINEKDVTNLFSWWIDKSIYQYDPRPFPQDTMSLMKECEYYTTKFEREIFNSDPSKNRYEYFMITDLKDITIGFVNAFSFDDVSKALEMGIIIGDKSYLRKGIASIAIQVVSDYYFQVRNVKRIIIETGTENIAAIKLASKLGFSKCETYAEDQFTYQVMEKLNA